MISRRNRIYAHNGKYIHKLYWLTPIQTKEKKICSVTLGVTITAPISTIILVHAIAIIPAVADHAAATLGAADAAAAVATTHGATSVAVAAAATTDAAILTMATAAAINADSAATTAADGIPVHADPTIFFGCRRR